RGRDRYAERLGGLEVDHQLVFGWRLHREIGWLFTFEDAIDVTSRVAEQLDQIGPIGDQATAGGGISFIKDRGQLVPRRQRDDQTAMNHRQCTSWHNQRAIRGAGKDRNSMLDPIDVAQIDGDQLYTKRLRSRLDSAPLTDSCGCAGVPQTATRLTLGAI